MLIRVVLCCVIFFTCVMLFFLLCNFGSFFVLLFSRTIRFCFGVVCVFRFAIVLHLKKEAKEEFMMESGGRIKPNNICNGICLFVFPRRVCARQCVLLNACSGQLSM